MLKQNDGYTVLAVVVTFNRKELLSQCITHLLAQENAACDVLVVDNASTDGTEDVVQAFKNDKIFYCNTKSNLGGAGGFNFGIKWAAQKNYNYVWIMDDDTFPTSEALENLISAKDILNDEFGFLSSVVLWKDGRECQMNRQKIKKQFYQHIELLPNSIIQIEQASFVSLLIPMKTVQLVGLPISKFYIWGDDLEYTRRISRKSELPCYLVGKSIVVHATEENTGSSLHLAQPNRINRFFYAYRNENYTYRKEGFHRFLFYWARCFRELYRICFKAKNYKLRRIGVLMKGFFCGLFFNPKVEYIETNPT